MPSNTITGIGSALVDVLINETDEFLHKLNKEKGGMTYVTSAEQQDIISASSQIPVIVPGGAACNTILGVGNLGGTARFIGARGEDEYGDIFEDKVWECQVEPVLSYFDTPTGKVLSIVTPDAQRSMFTDLGASSLLDPADVTSQMFSDTAIALVEGYLLFNRDLMMAAVKAAKAAGTLVALDLASFEVVNASQDILPDLVKEYVDILIANEDEAKAYTGESDESAALEKLSVNVTYAVLKVGSRGSYIWHNNTVTRIEPVKGNDPVDTTGAGDLWAAGFLYGIANGLSIEKSGRLGSMCGYEVCQVMGAQIPEQVWKKIRSTIEEHPPSK
ncbi:MAG: adenosine kinase [Desulfobacter sp.]|jgi:sugar/nucleoside kinase (ribokinase family)|uniref:adenosine kinase n=1 Tax=Desulfobacter sp. TaxID=2294 RepID=UPI001B51236A|nr:adenosine kinase [Desulfobacter sp.]MBP8830252.1 adenosine kinase [Desulfobacter sp.]